MKRSSHIIVKLLDILLDPAIKNEIIGDLLEAHAERSRKNRFIADVHLLLEFFISLKWSRMKFTQKNRLSTYWNSLSLRFSLRFLRRNLGETTVHIVGLSLGLTMCILLGLFYFHEKGYDKFHTDYERIFRVVNVAENDTKYGVTPWPTGPFIQADFAGVEATRVYHTFRKTPTLARLDKQTFFFEDDLFFVDSNFFNVLTFKLVAGEKHEVLAAPNSIVLSQNLATKLFKNEDPLGKELLFESTLRLKVTGIVENPPTNSHLQYQAFASLGDIAQIFEATGNRFSFDGWYWTAVNTYVRLPSNLSAQEFENELVEFTKRHVPQEFAHRRLFELQPLTDVHLQSSDIEDIFVEKRSEFEIKIAMLLGVIVLIIAVINFINLASASSSKRLHTFIIKQRLGASNANIFVQMLIEALIIVSVSMLIGLSLVSILLPYFNETINSNIGLGNYVQLKTLGTFVVSTCLVAILIGFYPAIYTLKNINIGSIGNHVKHNTITQKILVSFQLFTCLSLIYGSIIIYKQYSFLTQKDLGFQNENVLMIPIKGSEASINSTLFKNNFMQSAFVSNTSLLSDIIGVSAPLVPFHIDGSSEQQNIPTLFVDFDFVETFGLELVEGRNFNPAINSDSNSFIVNEAALTYFENGWENTRLNSGDGKIIGVLKNFNFLDLHQQMQPLIIGMSDSWRNYLSVRVQGTNFIEIYQELENKWRTLEPNRPFDAWFLSERINNLYKGEQNQSIIIGFFSLLSIVIAIIGLLALVTAFIQSRYKEIGIRKVLGASVKQIYYLVTRNITVIFVLVTILHVPVTRYFMQKWLENYPLHISQVWIYNVLAFGITWFLVWSLISFKCYQASHLNPLDVIKDE